MSCGGCIPLVFALNWKQREIACLFIDAGSPISGQRARNTPLEDILRYNMLYNYPDILRLLLARNPKDLFETPVSALHVAAAAGHLACAIALLGHDKQIKQFVSSNPATVVNEDASPYRDTDNGA